MATDTHTEETPAVVPSPPAQWLMRLANPVMRALLRSPLHMLVSGSLAVLWVRGHRTGREYAIPVRLHDQNDETFVLTGATWRLNIGDGADVEVTHRGRRAAKHAVTVANPEATAREYLRAIDRYGARRARGKMGVAVTDPERLTFEEMAAAAVRDNQVAIRLTDPE